MDRRPVPLIAVCLGVALATTTVMYHCDPPMDLEFCKAAFIVCKTMDEGNCTAAGGTVLAHGGLCNICDICVKTVGWGQHCNYTTENGGLVTFLCKPPLVCTLRHNGTCRRPEECL